MKTFIPLPHIVGNSFATETTVNLFNSVRVVYKDSNGKYLLTAVAPFLNGVIVNKEYIK